MASFSNDNKFGLAEEVKVLRYLRGLQINIANMILKEIQRFMNSSLGLIRKICIQQH